jgi:hypothetical protein
MIAYEELVAALDRYVARNGGTPMSARAPSSSGAGMTASAPPPTSAHDYGHDAHDAHDAHGAHESAFPSYDEHHDPDMPSEDATHVGASPGGSSLPPPLSPVAEDASNEIDIGDVLADDDLS